MLLQNGVHDAALHSHAPAMNDADFLKTLLFSLEQILFHEIRNLSWLKRMQVDRILDRQLHRLGHSASLPPLRECLLN